MRALGKYITRDMPIIIIDWHRCTGKTLNGPKHQDGRVQKDQMRVNNQPALLLLPSLRMPEAYRGRLEISKVPK